MKLHAGVPVLVVVAVFLVLTGCMVYSEETVARPGARGTLVVYVDPESVQEDGPVEVTVDGAFLGDIVRETSFTLKVGSHPVVCKRRGLRTYYRVVTITSDNPVRIAPTFAAE